MQNKLKPILGKIFISLGLVLILAITSVSSIYLTQKGVVSKLFNSETPNRTSFSKTLIALKPSPSNSKIDLAKVTLSNVERHDVPDARATVVYIPQLHKEPTTNPEDRRNDQATVVQKEITSMIENLSNNNNVTYVMDETDLYGPMPSDKMTKLKAGLSEIRQFKNDLEKLLSEYIKVGGSEISANMIRQQANIQISKVERKMYLTGGAAVAAAKNPNIHAYGSQNKETIDKARTELQNVLYMEQRISQLEGNSSGATTVATSGSGNSILSLLGQNQNTANPITQISSFAMSKSDSKLLANSQKVSMEMQNLLSKRDFETAGNGIVAAPANPYATRTDLANLKSEYAVYKANFMRLAKDQRSQEVVDNIDRMMTENNQKAAILVFGVGHKDQIVSALNQKGISVIVATPTSEPTNVAAVQG